MDKKTATTKPAKALRNRAEAKWGWLFMAPTIIGLVVLNIIPIFQTIQQTFYKTGDFGKGNIFIGLDNYRKMFADKQIWQALLNTFLYAIVEVPFSIAIALVLAVFLNRKMRGRGIYRTIYFLPMVAAPAAVAMVWRWLYNTDFGLINHLLSKVGIPPVSWMSNPNLSVFSIAFVGIWSCVGYNIVLFLAGLQEIPHDFYEAANIDGASSPLQFFKITLPLLSPNIFFVATTRTIAAMQVFDLIFMMIDRANPAMPRTQSLVYLFYKYSFIESNKGYGSTIIVLLLLVILLLTVIQQWAQKKWVHYD